MTDISATTWTPFAVNNNAAAPNGFAENDLPSVVDDWGRETMAGVRRAWERTNATITTTGAAGHYVYSTVNNSFPNAYVQGEVYSFKADKDATGFDDFVVNALGAKPLYIATTAGVIPIGPTQIKSGQVVSAVYDSALNTGGGGFQVIGVIPSSIVPTGGGTWQVGNIAFADAIYGLGQDPNLFWDQTNHRLGIGTTPRAPIDVFAAGSIFGQAGGNAAGPSATNTNMLLYFNNSGNWAGMGAHTDGSIYWATGTGGVSTKMYLQANTGDLGVGNLNPLYKVDVTGDINTTGSYRFAGRLFAVAAGNYNQIYDAAGNDAILLGFSGDQSNYFRNTAHFFESIHGGTIFSTISATGLRVQTNTSAAFQIDNGSGGNLFRFAANNVVDTSCPSARSDGTNLVFNAHPSGGLYLNNDITGGNVYVLGNANFGVAGGSSNWRTFIQGIGTTSATYQLVSDNAVGAGCLWVRDDGVISFPAYANGTLQVSSGAVVSTTTPTFGTTTTGNLTTSSIQCNGNFNATGNIACDFTVTATNSVNTTVYQLNGANFAQRENDGDRGFNKLYDFNGNQAIYLGGGADPTNYYRNTNHVFGSINQGTLYGFWEASGITVSTGGLTVAAGGMNVSGTINAGAFGTGGSIQGSTLTLTAGGTALFANNGDIRAVGNLIADINLYAGGSLNFANVATQLGVNPTGVGSNPCMFFNDGSDRTSVLLGSAAVPQNYYFQQEHYIADVGNASTYLRLRASDGLTTTYNITANDFIRPSDAQLKENVAEIMAPIDLLRSLRPVNFKYRNDPRLQHGLIAQDVLDTPFANLVHETKSIRSGKMPDDRFEEEEKTVLGLNYQGLIGPIVKAIQEIADRLDALEAPPKTKKKP